MQTLHRLPLGCSGRVTEVNAKGTFYRRMLDLGIVPGTKITALHKSITGDPVAYAIRGSVIALRKSDAANIRIQPIREGF